MMCDSSMKALIDALARREEAGQPVQLWLRDDDAIEPTQPLEKLLELTNRYDIPLTLAVIPAHSRDALASRLAHADNVTVVVHGWSHQNHEPADKKKQELGSRRPLPQTLAELSKGLTDLSRRHGSQFVPVLVPPWNRIASTVIDQLQGVGFHGLSTFRDQTSDSIAVVNPQIDVIDWKGSRAGRATSELVDEMLVLIENTHEPIGILTHHLVHDEQVWDFLEQLFAATAAHGEASWVSIRDLLPPLSAKP